VDSEAIVGSQIVVGVSGSPFDANYQGRGCCSLPCILMAWD